VAKEAVMDEAWKAMVGVLVAIVVCLVFNICYSWFDDENDKINKHGRP
jgi:hypothetical protein